MTKKKPENEKQKPGRKPKYSELDTLEKKIDEYFAVTPKNEYATNGLALYLGYNDKTSLYYNLDRIERIYNHKNSPEFSNPIKKALTRIELMHEIGLNGSNAAGHIFALKNSGWRDRIEQDINNKNGFTITVADNIHQRMMNDLQNANLN